MRLFGFRCFLMGSIGRGSKFLPKDSSLLEEGEYSKNDGHATSSFCSRWPFMFNSCALNLSHRYQSFSSIIIQEIHQIRTNWIQLAFFISFFGCSLHIMTEQVFFFILGFFFKAFRSRGKRNFWGTDSHAWCALKREVSLKFKTKVFESCLLKVIDTA